MEFVVRQGLRSFSDKTRPINEVARNLRAYAGAILDDAIAAKLLAAAAEIDAREQAHHASRVEVP